MRKKRDSRDLLLGAREQRGSFPGRRLSAFTAQLRVSPLLGLAAARFPCSCSPLSVLCFIWQLHVRQKLHTHTHTRTGSRFSGVPVEIPEDPQRCRGLLRAEDKTPRGSRRRATVFLPRELCQVGGGWLSLHCRLRQQWHPGFWSRCSESQAAALPSSTSWQWELGSQRLVNHSNA